MLCFTDVRYVLVQNGVLKGVVQKIWHPRLIPYAFASKNIHLQ